MQNKSHLYNTLECLFLLSDHGKLYSDCSLRCRFEEEILHLVFYDDFGIDMLLFRIKQDGEMQFKFLHSFVTRDDKYHVSEFIRDSITTCEDFCTNTEDYEQAATFRDAIIWLKEKTSKQTTTTQ